MKEDIIKRCRIFVGFGLLALLCGCIPSLHPLYTDKDLIFESGLVGQWVEESSKEIWHFEKAGEKKYSLTYTDDEGEKGEFDVHLLKVNGHMFLDLFPKMPELEQNDFYKWHILPAHTFFHVKQIEPTLQMRSMIDPESFEKVVQKHPDAIRHEKIEDGEIVLTDRPEALQAFLLKHLDDERVFGEFSDLKKRVPKDDR